MAIPRMPEAEAGLMADDLKVRAARKKKRAAEVATVQQEIRKPGSVVPLQKPRPDENAARLAARAEADQTLADAAAGRASPHQKRMQEIQGQDLEGAAAETLRTTPPTGMPASEAATFSAYPPNVQRALRSITSPTGTTPRGAYPALMGGASKNWQYALGQAGGDLGDAAAAGREAGERARGVRPGDKAAIGDVGGQLIQPKITDNALPENIINGVRQGPAMGQTAAHQQRLLKAAEQEHKFNTRAKETTDRANSIRKQADAATAAAKTPEELAHAQKLHEMADQFQQQADAHEKNAQEIHQEAQEQPAGVGTTKRIAREQGVSQSEARKLMESGDWTNERPARAILHVLKDRAAWAGRGYETAEMMKRLAGSGRFIPQVAAMAKQMLQTKKITPEQFEETMHILSQKADEEAELKAGATQTGREQLQRERLQATSTEHDKSIAAAAQHQQVGIAAAAAKPVYPKVISGWLDGNQVHYQVTTGSGGQLQLTPLQVAPNASVQQLDIRGNVAGAAPILPAPAPAGTAPAAPAPAAPAPAPTAATPGKVLDAETAQRLLNEAGGDKEKARAAALALGYSF